MKIEEEEKENSSSDSEHMCEWLKDQLENVDENLTPDKGMEVILYQT